MSFTPSTSVESIAAAWDLPLAATYMWRSQVDGHQSVLPNKLICLTCGVLVPNTRKARKKHTHERATWTFRLVDSFTVATGDVTSITTLMYASYPQGGAA